MGVKIEIKDGKAVINCTMCKSQCDDHKIKICEIVFSKQCSNLTYDTAWPMGGIIIYDCGDVCVNSPGENLCDPDKAFIFVKDSKTIQKNLKNGDAGQIHGTLTRMITGHSAQDFFRGKGCLGGFAGDRNKILKYTSRSLNYHKEDPTSQHREDTAQMTDTEKLVVFRSVKSWENMLQTSSYNLTCRIEDLFPKHLSCSPNDPDYPNVIEKVAGSYRLNYSKQNALIPIATVHVSCQSDVTPTGNMIGVIIYKMPLAMRESKIKWKPGYIFFKNTKTIQRHFRDGNYMLDNGKCGAARLVQYLTDVDVSEESEWKRGIYNSFAIVNGHLRFLWNASPIEREAIGRAVQEFERSAGRCQNVNLATCA